jgi:hypothetical protein
MRKCFTILFTLVSISLYARPDTASNAAKYTTYERHSVIASVSLGFADFYRQYYSLAPGFEKSNTSGFAPVYFKIEYALSNTFSLAASFGYDAFLSNFKQDYVGNNGPFTRYIANNTRILSGGLVAYYHLGKVIKVKHLDPFVGVGLSLNNIRYGAYPQGDSTLTKFDHTVTPYLKAGARYYISSIYSIFGDVGYDQHSIVSLGFSCRFLSKKNKRGY